MIRIVLADDHPVVLSGYRRLLERDGEMVVIGEAVDGDAAYQLCAQHEPDLLVSDIAMPGGGLDLLQRARRRVPSLRVLLFSMLDSALLVRRAFDAGAAGFLTKASPPERLIDAVRALHAGRRYLDRALGTDEAKLRAWSPAQNVDKIRVPVFMAQGSIDRRVPMEQFEALQGAFKSAGRPLETMVAQGEGHGFYKPENRAELYRKIAAFLDKHIGRSPSP